MVNFTVNSTLEYIDDNSPFSPFYVNLANFN